MTTTTERTLPAKITRAGMRALFSAQNNGLDLKLSHIAVGRAGAAAGRAGGNGGYLPNGNETALMTEFDRVAIGGGDYLSDYEIMVSGLMVSAPEGWVHEIGIFADDGTLFALWSEVNAPLGYKTPGIQFIVSLTLAVSEVPPNALTIMVGAPNVNITIAGELAVFATELIRLQNRTINADVERYTAEITSTWY
ncbi:MAG: phage tail protein [Hyphomicrobium sp.]